MRTYCTHRGLYLRLCGGLDEKEIRKGGNRHMCMADAACCMAETNTTLYSNYIPIKINFLKNEEAGKKKKRKKRSPGISPPCSALSSFSGEVASPPCLQAGSHPSIHISLSKLWALQTPPFSILQPYTCAYHTVAL